MNIQNDILLKPYTTLNIGGPAKLFTEVSTKEQLIDALKYAKNNNIPFKVIGGGSNLLINDNGTPLFIIKNSIGTIHITSDRVTVHSGTILQEFVDKIIAHGLSGAHKLTGIPGTVGGAVYGNAGAYGQTISDHLDTITCLNDDFEEVTIGNDAAKFSYRDSIFKRNNATVLSATFTFPFADKIELQKESDQILKTRLVRYPKGTKCPGSFFKNIVADTLPEETIKKIPADKIVYGKVPAGALLELVGAKGDHEGDIFIAPYHANLFVNKGEGTARDFYSLAEKYFKKVKETFDVELEPEVQFINLPALSFERLDTSQ